MVVHAGEGSVEAWRPLDIAMIGQKGLPATFGGIERHVEEIGWRLAARGHRVRVYCRHSYGEFGGPEYRGMELRVAPTVASKHLDAIVASATSTGMAMAAHSDIVHFHALGPGLMAPLPRYLSRAGVVLTVHGLDHQRGKWGRGAQAMLGTAHWMSGRVPKRTVVVSRDLQQHYRSEFGRAAVYIPNGVDDPPVLAPRRIQAELGLEPGSYALFVGRLVPEKAPDQLVRAYRDVPGDRKLVVVGDSSFSQEYTDSLKELARHDPRVVFTGFAFGDLLGELYRHAAVFVQPSLLEGLPITLLEAASYGVPVVASDIAPHLEVMGTVSGPGRRTFPTGDLPALARALTAALDAAGDPDSAAYRLERDGAEGLRKEVLSGYNWDDATDQLERLYLEVAPRRRFRRRPDPR
jgi:glycosyltransferase involved in cell wall biosynthesis